MDKIENALILFFQVAIVATIIGIGAMWAVDAWVTEDDARVAKLKQHFWDLAYSRVEGPKAPTGLKPNYGASSEPKTRVFADASVKSEAINRQTEKKREGLK